MRIAVILTGGTILSEEQSGFYALSDNKKSEILSLIPSGFETEVFSPYIILSEQLDGEYLSALIDEVAQKLSGEYDGVIILHGTDTLQFSAAALSLAFGDADIPVVLVSSNYVLSDERSNGRDNLFYAFRFLEQRIGGVFVSYKNMNEAPSVYLGDTLLPHLTYSDELRSINGAFGYFDGEDFIRLSEKPETEALGKFRLSKSSPVLWLKAAAGLALPSADGYRAILLEAYHSGTLPTADEGFVKYCEGCDIPIYVVGVSDGTQYASTKEYDRLGLRILPYVSPVFAYVSLWQKYSF